MLSSTLETEAAVDAPAVATTTEAQPQIIEHEAAETYVWDGVVYNADGEEIGLADLDPILDPGDDEDERIANKVLRSMTRTYHRGAGAEARFSEIKKELEEMQKAALDAMAATPEYRALRSEADQALNISRKAEKRLEWLKATYTEFLRLFARPRLPKGSKTLETLAGSISLRKVPAKLDVTDEDQAVKALESLGQTDAIKRTVLKSGISDELAAQILEGKATLSGISVVAETTKLGVSVGGVKIV